jgi:hypothetical protein
VLIIRLAGIAFAVIQVTLALRLLLPFVEVPTGFEDYLPGLRAVTELWLAPFAAIVDQLDVLGSGASLDSGWPEEDREPTTFEPAVVVAMIGWAIVAAFVLFVLRLIFRPVG